PPDDFLSFDRLIRGIPKLAHSSAPGSHLFGDKRFQRQPVLLSPNNNLTVTESNNLVAPDAQRAAAGHLLAGLGSGRCSYNPPPRAWKRYRVLPQRLWLSHPE